MKSVDRLKDEKETLDFLVKLNKKEIKETEYGLLHQGLDKVSELTGQILTKKNYNSKDIQELLNYSIKKYLLHNDLMYIIFNKYNYAENIVSLFISYMINNTKEQVINIDTQDYKLDYIGYKAKNKTLILNSKNYGHNTAREAENCNIIVNKFSNEFTNSLSYAYLEDELENGIKIFSTSKNKFILNMKKENNEKETTPQVIKLNNIYFLIKKEGITSVNELEAIAVLKNKNNLSELEEKLMEELIGTIENACPECSEERPKLHKKYLNSCEKCGYEYKIQIIKNQKNEKEQELEIAE